MENFTKFRQSRADCIASYAHLEFGLCLIFSVAGDIEFPAAQAIFFRISNTRSRYAIIDDMFRLQMPDYRKAWQVHEKWLSPIDQDRNKVVHWHQNNSGTQFLPDTKFWLDPPGRQYTGTDVPQFTPSDMQKFRFICVEMTLIVDRFIHVLKSDKPTPSTEIFLQLQNGLTPTEFLQSLTDAEPVIPDQSSPE